MKRGTHPRSLENLKMSPEKRAKALEKRAITMKSAEFKQKMQDKKDMAECLKEIMKLDVPLSTLEELGVNANTIQLLSAMKGRTVTTQQAMLAGITAKAINEQDVASAVFIRDTMGEKAPEKVESSVSIEDYVANHKPKL